MPFVSREGEWRLDLAALEAAVTDSTSVLFLMNPSMPSGAVLDDEEWEAVREVDAQLSTEEREGSRARPVVLADSGGANFAEEIEVGLHG